MKNMISFIASVFLLSAGCKKDSDTHAVGKSNDNIVKGNITVNQTPNELFYMTGDSTGFSVGIDDIYHDTLYGFVAGDTNRRINFYIVGLMEPGTYEFSPGAVTATNYSSVVYTQTGGGYPSVFAASYTTNANGDTLSHGTYTIIQLNHESMEGYIKADLGDADGNRVILDSIYFKGKFQ